MNEKGYILLSRAILDSDVFASQKLLKIWVWCLCKANFKDRSIPLKIGRGETVVKVKRGQFIFGRFKAEEELFIDGSTIYKSIKKLEEHQMIKIESNSQYSVITICKYDTYQDSNTYKVTTKEQPSNNQVTADEQPSNTTNTLNTLNTLPKVNKECIEKNAHEFLNENYKTILESVEMKYKSQIPDYGDFLKNFNLKVDEEQLEYKPRVLLSRLERMAINWIKYSQKDKEKSSAKKEKTLVTNRP